MTQASSDILHERWPVKHTKMPDCVPNRLQVSSCWLCQNNSPVFTFSTFVDYAASVECTSTRFELDMVNHTRRPTRQPPPKPPPPNPSQPTPSNPAFNSHHLVFPTPNSHLSNSSTTTKDHSHRPAKEADALKSASRLRISPQSSQVFSPHNPISPSVNSL